jgi:hypothetical protein
MKLPRLRVDTGGERNEEFWARFFKRLNDFLTQIHDAVNFNESQTLEGKFLYVPAAGGSTLYCCMWNGSAYAWESIKVSGAP